jgi:hypothetical protein
MDFFFAPETDVYEPRVSISNIPWLWVGGTTTNGVDCSVTNELNSAIDYGDIVNAEFINNATGITDVIGWKYLDPTELIEKDFPSAGFLIEDDTIKHGTTEEIKSDADISDNQ